MKFVLGNQFYDSLNDLSKKGQTFAKPLEKAISILQRSEKSNDLDSVFQGVKKTNNGEKRIKHAVKYDIGRACRFITYQNNNICMFLFVGDHDSSDNWIEKNRGLELGLGKSDNSYKIYYASSNKSVDERPQSSITPENFSLTDHLPEAFKNSFFNELGLKQNWKSIEKITKLTSMSSDDEIEDALNDVNDSRLYDVLVDVLILSRQKKNLPQVEQRINAYLGEIIPIDEVEEDRLQNANESLDVQEVKLDSDVSSGYIENALRSKDFKRWMVFMHPQQKWLSEEDFAGPAVLKGVSGSGKTAVVVNRALYLSKKYPNERIGIFTLNKSLATLIQKLVKAMTGSDSNIEVLSFWEVCKELLSEFEPERTRHFDDITWKTKEDISDIWMEFYHQETEQEANVMFPVHQSLLSQSIYPEEYIKEEFDFIRSALFGETRNEYLQMKREGRCIALNSEYRSLVLAGLKAWEKKMDWVGNIDYVGVTSRVFKHIDKIEARYRSVLIDEMQDFGTLELNILRKLVKDNENDLFFAGDLIQRVHTKQHSFRAAKITIPNDRKFVIKQNYRNSKEILEAANFILEDNLTGTNFEDASIEVIEPEYAPSSDDLPYLLEADTLNEELTSAVQYLQERIKEDGPGHNGCIAICGYSLCELAPLARKLKVQMLDNNINLSEKSIFISDLEQTKGFEFDHMIIVSCNEKSLPNPNLPKEEAFRDLSRFYIAMTRARRNLVISYNGAKSEFLKNVEDYFILDKWSNQILLNDFINIRAPKPVRSSERFLNSNQTTELKYKFGDLSGKELLLTRRAIGMSRTRQDRLLKYITGKNRKSDDIRNRQWESLNELYKENNVTINTIIAGNSDVAHEKKYFETTFSISDENTGVEIQKRMRTSPLAEKNPSGIWGEDPPGWKDIITNETNNREEEKRHHSSSSDLHESHITPQAWEVEVKTEYTIGVCMHCGRPAMQGDYVCYACNPG